MIKLIESQEEAELVKLKFNEGLTLDPLLDKAEFSSFEINWVDRFSCYGECKNACIDLFQKDDGDDRLFFIGHNKDMVKGKPQLIHETIQRIPLVRRIWKLIKKPNQGEDYETTYKFIDEPFDRRYAGKILSTIAFDFWVYRIVDNGKEFYIFSQDKLPNEFCELEGMKINLDDVSEISNNLKLNKISSIFICKKANPSVKIISPQELIKFAQDNGLNEETFHNELFMHPDGNIYDYTLDFNLLRKAQLLSGKYEGYPLHLMKMGPVGTGKTTEAEVIDYKFKEDQGILEASNSTLKCIVPSFKEKPANLGYICKCNRVAIIDEMMKMVEAALGHDSSRISNYFGQMNMLLEHKDRMVGSGNDNSTKIKATAKVCITTNNVSGKSKIANHLGVIDPTTLSRMIVWVQDYEEIEKIYRKEGVKSPPHIDYPPKDFSRDKVFSVHTRDGDGVGGNFCNFLTIFDSCQKFLVQFDMDRCKKLFDMITNLTKEPMRQVWRARGLHHTILILDGLVKHRCIFKDYDSTFEPKEEDYSCLERILVHMVNTWETSFDRDSWKEALRR